MGGRVVDEVALDSVEGGCCDGGGGREGEEGGEDLHRGRASRELRVRCRVGSSVGEVSK